MYLSVQNKDDTKWEAQVSFMNFRRSLDMNKNQSSKLLSTVLSQFRKETSFHLADMWLKFPQKKIYCDFSFK